MRKKYKWHGFGATVGRESKDQQPQDQGEGKSGLHSLRDTGGLTTNIILSFYLPMFFF